MKSTFNGFSFNENVFFSFSTVLIITSPLNSPETLNLLEQLSIFNRSKILIIDIIGTIFNKQSEFYNAINRNKDKWLTSNLLVLTTLTTKLKRFLNATFTTEYNSIYGQMTTEPMTTFTESTITTAQSQHHNGNDDAVDMMLSILIQRATNDSKILEFFNKNELKLVDSIFESIFNISNCNLQVENVSRAVHTDIKQNSDKFHQQACAMHNNSLIKCESYVRTKVNVEATAIANETRTVDASIIKVLCEQLFERWQQQHMNHNKSMTTMMPINESFVESTTSTTTNSEFINLISNQMDGKITEYFPFFDFIVTKLAQTYNLTTVNYNNNESSGGVGSGVGGNLTWTNHTLSDTFDFCVLDFRSNQMSIENDSHGRQTTFAWRPVLILRQNELHQNIFITHPLQSITNRWFYDNTHKFWTCGLLCWILAGIVVLLLVCILVGSITFGLAIR